MGSFSTPGYLLNACMHDTKPMVTKLEKAVGNGRHFLLFFLFHTHVEHLQLVAVVRLRLLNNFPSD